MIPKTLKGDFKSMRVRNVYLMGTAYCGSTLLGNALNGHQLINYAGEIERLPGFNNANKIAMCPACMANKTPCPVWSKELIGKIAEAGPGRTLALYREVTQTPIIVDGSKHAYWLRDVHVHGGISTDTIAIISVRSPFAFANSLRRYDPHREIWQGANLWRDTYFDILRTLGTLNIPRIIVRYEDFAFKPDNSLRRICGFLKIPFDHQMLSFWEQPIHAIGGNWGAYVWYKNSENLINFQPSKKNVTARKSYKTNKFGGWVDEKWRASLLPHEIRAILTTPGLMDIAAILGYDIGEILLKSQN